MLNFGGGKSRTCQGVQRRTFLQAGSISALGLTLGEHLRLRALGSETETPIRSVMLVWLWGGPAHLDTWDPKPDIPLEYRGPFSAIETSVPGVRIGELFPKLAQQAHRYTIVRSLVTESNDHGVAGTIGLTGSAAGGVGLDGKPLAGNPRPTLGSVVARFAPRTGKLPPFLVLGNQLHQGKKAIIGEGAGTLGGLYNPFRLEFQPGVGSRVPMLDLPDDLSAGRLSTRRHLLERIEQSRQTAELARSSGTIDAYREQAFSMLTAQRTLSAFDLESETDVTRNRYGRGRFGQCCLLGRRLVEAEVPFIQINWSDHVEAEEDAGDGGWDHHYRNFQIMQDRHAPWLDQSLSALLEDLDQRGLLQSTLVVAVGEFGRSPKINKMAGRDHWPHCYSALIAGGKAGNTPVIGSSDRLGEHPRERPITPGDLLATIQHSVGITSEHLANAGLSLSGTVIEELA